MVLLAGYLLLINLTAFVLYGIDKRRAVRKIQRISERTLLLIALAGGSLGALIGMYLFRHKTRKWVFFIGVPVMLVLHLVLLVFLLRHNVHEKTRPSGVVRAQLEQVQALDEDTIRNIISFETLSGRITGTYNPDLAGSAVLAFFKHFQYSIESESIQGDHAEVSVKISNIDMRTLASDLCAALTQQRIDMLDHPAVVQDTDYFSLLGDMLSSHEYEIITTDARFHLVKEGKNWTIITDEQLQDELTGGFISAVSDPMLLDPSQVLSMYMEKYKTLTADEWLNYLDVHNIFSTYSPDHMDELDHLYMEKIAEYFDYRIDSCRLTAAGAEADLTITSLNMPEIIKAYRASLLEYAATTESITSDSVSLANTTASLLIQAIEENAAPAEYKASAHLTNDERSWQLEMDEDLTNAFLGNMEEALQILREESDPS